MKQNKLQNNTDTIVAVATAPGRGGVGIVRLSGGDLSVFAADLFVGSKTPQPRTAAYSQFLDAQGDSIDEGVALYFPGPNSLLVKMY
jgi:tRNA modification GTPase